MPLHFSIGMVWSVLRDTLFKNAFFYWYWHVVDLQVSLLSGMSGMFVLCFFLLPYKENVLSFTPPLPTVFMRYISILNSFSSPEMSPFQNFLFFFAMLSLFLVVRFLIYKIAFLCLINFHSCGGLHSDDFRSITDVLLVLPSQVYESDQGLPCNSQGLTAGQWERTHQDSMFIFIITGILKFGQYFIFLWCWQHEF